MISKTLGLSGPSPPTPPSASGFTNVTARVAVVVPSPSETVSVTAKVPGVALVSVAFGAIGLSMTPPVVLQ